jgi:hypothetical protein
MMLSRSLLSLYFILLASKSISNALQFLRATTFVGNYNSTAFLSIDTARGVDFTLYRAVDVTAIGLLDADERGFNGTFSARIFDRSTDLVVVGPVSVYSTDARSDDQNPFVFKNVMRTRLPPGVYSVITICTSNNDRWLITGAAFGPVVTSDDGNGTVVITNLVWGGNGLSASAAINSATGQLWAGATFLFEVVPTDVVALPQPEYPDCEAVACARLESGEYNIQGQARYCDNDEAGGGWLRLWRTNDTSCEASDWTSARNPSAVGGDPVGCRPTSAACSSNRVNSPVAFNEVRGSNWIVWALGTPDAFETTLPCEGILIRDGNGAHVWALLAGNPGILPALCPCEPQFTNSSFNWPNRVVAGDHWMCDRVPAQTGGAWVKLFHGQSRFLCAGQANATTGDLLRFQRTLEKPQVALSVSLCVNERPALEDLKLASGDLFVRATVGFDRNQHCPTTMAAATPSGVSSSTTFVGVASDNDGVDAYWIIPTAIACVLAIFVCMLVAVLVTSKLRSNNATKNKSNQQQINDVSNKEVSNKAPKDQYSDRLSDVVPRESRSQYGALSTRERGD